MKWCRRHRPIVVSTVVASVVTIVSALVIAKARTEARLSTELGAEQRKVAAVQKSLADARQLTLRQFDYVARINLANQSWMRSEFDEARRHLAQCVPKPGDEDLRGFEWHWLDLVTREDQSVWNRHQGECTSAQFSRDGALLATSGEDGVRVWNSATGEQVAHLTAHRGEVEAIAFSADGKWLATAGWDQTARIWDTSGWQEQRSFPHGGPVSCVVFSPDGRWLASTERDTGPDSFGPHRGEHLVRVWDTTTWKVYARLSDHVSTLHCVTFSADSTLMASAGADGQVLVWNVPKFETRVRLPHGIHVNSVAFAAKLPLIATAGIDNICRLWNLKDGSLQESLASPKEYPMESVAFSSDDSAIVTADRSGMIRVWEYADAFRKRFPSQVFRAGSFATSALFAPGDRTLFSTHRDGTIRRWDTLHPPGRQRILGDFGFGTTDVAFSPDGTALAVAADSVDLYDARTGDKTTQIAPANEGSSAVVFLNRNTLAARSDGASVWTLGPPAIKTAIYRHHESLLYFSAGPDDGSLALGDPTAAPFLYDIRTGQQRPSALDLLRNSGWVTFAPEARLFAAILGAARSHRTTLEVRDWPSGDLRLRSAGRYESMAFSRDGTNLAAGGGDGTLTMWKTDAWNESNLAVGHTGPIISLSFSVDGRTLAGACQDGSVKLWNVATGRELLTLEAHSLRGDRVQFGSDGRTLASGGMCAKVPARHEVLLWTIVRPRRECRGRFQRPRHCGTPAPQLN